MVPNGVHMPVLAAGAAEAGEGTGAETRPLRILFIGQAVERTPTHYSRTLSRIAGCDIWLKFENLQFTASFNERGALNKLT